MKGLWKQGGGMVSVIDVGHLNPLGRSGRRARLAVYGFAVAFAAFTAYVAFCSPAAASGGGGGVSWFGGVYASTAPYRSQVSSFFSSIFPADSSSSSSAPSPELPRLAGGRSSEGGGGEVGRDGIDKKVGSEVGSSGSADQLRSGGSAPSSNASGGSAPPAGSSAGTASAAAAKSGGADGGGTPAANGGAAVSSAVDRSKANDGGSQGGDGRGSPTTTSSSTGEQGADSSNKQSGSGRGAPSNGAAVSAGNGGAAKADAKVVAIGAPSNNSAGTGSSEKADSDVGSNNQKGSGSGSGVASSVSAAGNSTALKDDANVAVVAASTASAGSGSDVKADLSNGSGSQAGSGSGDASRKSDVTPSPAKSSAEVGRTSNQTGSPVISGMKESGSPNKNQTLVTSPSVKNQNHTSSGGVASVGSGDMVDKQKEAIPQGSAGSSKDHPAQAIISKVGNNSEVLVKGNGSSDKNAGNKVDWIKEMAGCDMFHGSWVRDDSYPLYPEGSCPHIDEPFDCYMNGRPDRAYQKLRWQPSGCSIPRLNPTDMLERLRGKRLVFVGDSLNRNMWESLVCILRNSVKDKRKVFEASGRREFKTEGSYSFLFTDYNCSVEFFRSPFLVQEWEMKVSNGKKKETLRLDIVEQSSPKYKDADFIIFNTGHWWTHEKTALGKDYYQEGNHVYSELNVVDAFHKALVTWSKWIDTNVNPKKTTVLFRGYSASHFSGGQWNSGGSCDKETLPIRNEQYLSTYPPKMSILEDVIHKMKTPVVYLNITRMTDYRKDAHPSVYRKQNLTEEERRSPERFQDCSHWCLPGVPDSWNELVYAQLLIKQHQMLLQ